MKARFSTLDIIAILPELKAKICTGWRVNQVYDCDHKTYLFKLNKSIVQMKKDDDPLNVDEETANKLTFVIESGQRIHTTAYDWPKSPAPSSFATKLRKFLRNKRVENISQIGIDRLIDIQFGSNLAANHLIIELYDRGNLILTDNNYCILALLRWRKPDKNAKQTDADPDDSENFRVGDKYPLSRVRKEEDLGTLNLSRIEELIKNSQIILSESQSYKKRNKLKQQTDDQGLEINLKDLLNPYVIYGSSLLEDKIIKHLHKNGFNHKKCIAQISKDQSGKLDSDQVRRYAESVRDALSEASDILHELKSRHKSPGYIVQKQQISNISDELKDKNNSYSKTSDKTKVIKTNIDFFPILSCAQRKIELESNNLIYEEYESFDKAVDIYYCNLESQKLDTQALVAEKDATKKLNNLKISQEKRLDSLAKSQKEDELRAKLIELNHNQVDKAISYIKGMLAKKIPWTDIWNKIQASKAEGDPIASLITNVKFDKNEFTMKLTDPYEEIEQGLESPGKGFAKKGNSSKNIDIDIGLSAFANARRFFVKRRAAVNKERKTLEVSKKAYKNVERQTKELIKGMVVKTNITKARKRYWFENFFWFISSDGYLVVAGRDAEQNELLVKRYMKTNDIYVHGDLHGASSVIIKNEFPGPVPPKTLTEAGTMAVCYSSAWESKIATTSWWVYPNQVSKTAPAGQYVGLGAFIIRGKKNYLPLSTLVLGFGFLFRLDEESIERRKELRILKESNAMQNIETESQLGVNSDTGSDQIQDIEDSGSDISIEELHDIEPSNSQVIDVDQESKHQDDTDEIDNRNDDDDEEDEDPSNKVIEHRLVDTLSENPHQDDSLLYAIPMCGPYSAFSSFKYKVKVIPGAMKRGKAAKSCLGLFMHDKRASQREKDLLRALKDQDFARNIPNKVKVSFSNMKSMIKKKPKKSEVRLPMKT